MLTIRVIKQDLTTVPCDLLVNAANKELSDGGGVDGAITRVGNLSNLKKQAKKTYLDSINAVNKKKKTKKSRCQRLTVGDAVFTGVGSLPCARIGVAHTVGPIWSKKDEDESRNLSRKAYCSALQIAVDKKAKQICFPFISTGIYHCPLEEGVFIGIESVLLFKRDVANAAEITDVVFATLSNDFVTQFVSLLGSTNVTIASKQRARELLASLASSSQQYVKCKTKVAPQLSQSSSRNKLSLGDKLKVALKMKTIRGFFDGKKDRERTRQKERYHGEQREEKLQKQKTAYQFKKEKERERSLHRYYQQRTDKIEYGKRRYIAKASTIRPYQQKYEQRKRERQGFSLNDSDARSLKRQRLQKVRRNAQGVIKVARPKKKPLLPNRSVLWDKKYFRDMRRLRAVVADEVKRGKNKKNISVFEKARLRFFPTQTSYHQKRVRAVFKILNITEESGSERELKEQLTILVAKMQKFPSNSDLNKKEDYVRGTFGIIVRNTKIRHSVHDELDNILRRFLRCLSLPVARRTSESDADYSLRQVAGVSYHVRSHDTLEMQKEEGYEPLSEVYPRAYSIFCGKQLSSAKDVDEVNIECETDAPAVLPDGQNDDNEEFGIEHSTNATLAKLCTVTCRHPLGWLERLVGKVKLSKSVKGAQIVEAIAKFEECAECEVDPDHCLDDCFDAYRILNVVSPCYNGIRSMQRRYQELRRVISWLQSFDQAVAHADFERTRELCKRAQVPVRPGQLLLSHGKPADRSHHHEENVKELFAPVLDRFRKALEDEQKKCICDICYERRRDKDVKNLGKKTPELIEKLKKNMLPEHITLLENPQVCTRCLVYHKKGTMSPFSMLNNLRVDAIPEELADLSIIERIIIAQYRSCQAVVKLQPQTGKARHPHSASRGCAIIVPNNPDGNVARVITTLPSSDSLRIVVETKSNAGNVGKHIVDMNKVIRALMWLKKNNVLYQDFVILDQMTFQDDNIIVIPTDDSNTLVTENTCLTPMDCVGMTESHARPEPVESLYNLKHSEGKPINKLGDKNIDTLAYPHLFPYGTGGVFGKRKGVTMTTFLKHKMNSMDRTIARDKKYLLEWANTKDFKILSEEIRVNMKMKIDGRTLMDKLKSGDPSIYDRMFSGFSSIPSSPAYWNQVKNDLRGAIHFFGPPTFFLTLNPAENYWVDMFNFLKAIYPECTQEDVQRLCAEDPALLSEHFHMRVRVFFEEVLKHKDSPFDKLIHYVLRYEWQKRGAPHCHSLLWIEGAPKIGEDSDEDVLKFIDGFITCAMPDEETQPELAKIVRDFQVHRFPCSGTCWRTFTDTNTGVRKGICRFGFPRPVCSRTAFAESRNNESLERDRLYNIQRTEEEVRVNDYSPLIALLWKGNHDIQYVANADESILSYVLSYASKPETNSVIKDMIHSAPATASVFGLTHALLKKTETSACEAADRLLGAKFFERSHNVAWINLNRSPDRPRVALKLSEVKNAEKERTTMKNTLDDYYPSRPDELESISLANYVMNFQKCAAKSTVVDNNNEEVNENLVRECGEDEQEIDAINEEEQRDVTAGNTSNRKAVDTLPACWKTRDPNSPFYQHPGGRRYVLQNNNGIVRGKFKLSLFRVYLPDPEDTPEKQEDFYRRLLLLFKPWRTEPSKPTSPSWTEDFETWINEVPDVTKEIVLLFVEKVKSMRVEWKVSAEERKARNKAIAHLVLDEEDEEIVLPTRIVDEVEAQEKLNSMNQQQKEIFDRVIERVREQAEGKTKDPLLLFVTGCAGTGKSHMIDCIADELTMKYGIVGREGREPPVLLSAFTGLAAKHIRGSTLHSLFTFVVQIGRSQKYEALGPENLQEKKILLRNCRLLIIDEISMTSNILLTQVHLRLQEIMGNDLPFGGINVLLTGDLLQLPPVMAPPVYQEMSAELVNKTFGTVGVSVNMWTLFQYSELTENMRQRGDLEYAEMMGRLRIGCSTDEDVMLFKTRFLKSIQGAVIPSNAMPTAATLEETVNYYVQLLEEDSKSLALFASNDQVDTFNLAVTNSLKLDGLVEILAMDSEPIAIHKRGTRDRPFLKRDTRRFKVKRRQFYPTKEPNSPNGDFSGNRSAGLVSKLTVAIGSRVMLRRNIDHAAGLVNGALGVVQSITKMGDVVISISVLFDHIVDIIPITKVTATYKKSRNASYATKRMQFPLSLAYGVTVHKCQGMSATNVLLDLSKTFEFSQGYVALSRARSLEGVHIVDINNKAFGCLEASVIEYNRLRKLAGMNPFPEWNTRLHTNKQKGNQIQLPSKNSSSRKPAAPASKTNEQNSTATVFSKRKRCTKEKKTTDVDETRSSTSSNLRLTRSRTLQNSTVITTEQSDKEETAMTTRSGRRLVAPTAPVIRRTRRSGVTEPTDAEVVASWPHILQNPNQTFCFMNSLLQCLFALPSFCSELQNRIVTVRLQRLQEIYQKREPQVVSELRKFFPNLLQGQQDADSFFMELMWQLPQELMNLFQYERTTTTMCTVCFTQQVERDRNVFSSFIHKDNRGCVHLGGDLARSFSGMTECRNCQGDAEVTSTFNIPESNRILVLNVQLFGFSRSQVRAVRVGAVVDGSPNDTIVAGGSVYELKAVVQHIGESPHAGHYIAHVRAGSNWITADDDHISVRPQMSFDNAYMTFYHKME